MRHFRGSRGSRRGSSYPRSMVRSVKYIVNIGGASEGSGVQVQTIAAGKDNTTLGQVDTFDTEVPVGSRITKLLLMCPKVNLGSSTANFICWTLQKIRVGQTVQDPLLAGGKAQRQNIHLTGMLGLGAGQNNSLIIKFNIPKGLQRMGDGEGWQLVTNNGLAVSTQYQFIYKVWQ